MAVHESTYMTCRIGSHNKWYRASIEDRPGGYVVAYAYGPIGSQMDSGLKTPEPLSWEKAYKKYQSLINSKLNKSEPYVIETDDGSPTVNQAAPQSGQTEAAPGTGLAPQLLVPIENEEDVQKYIDDPAFCAQEKFDGKRKMYRYANQECTPVNRKGKAVTGPTAICEAVEALAEANEMGKLIIDGEEIDETLWVFDILAKDLTYDERYRILKGLMDKPVRSGEHPRDALQLVPIARTKAQKQALFNALKAAGREGIVFKRLDAEYTAGRPDDQFKFKFYATASCIVKKINTKRSIALELLDSEENCVSVGNCTIPPNKFVPKKGDIVEIRYLYAYKGGSLYQPTYIGVRDDIDLDACTMSQLKYKSEDKGTVGIQPAVKRKINWK